MARIAFKGEFPSAPAIPAGGWVMPDPILDYLGPDSGFSIDLGSAACFARQANPVNGDALVNFANKAATRNGVVTNPTGVTFSGNGFDFTGITDRGRFVAVANAFEAIQADADKAWLASYWVKFPAAADWPTLGRSLSAAGNYNSAADLFTYYIITNAGSKDIIIRPQTAIGASTAISVVGGGVTFGGKVCQVFVYRKADGTTQVRILAADGSASYLSTTQVLAENAATLSGLTWRFGAMDGTMTASNFSAAGTWGADDIGAAKHRLYRATVASMANIGARSPLEIADMDFAAVTGRAVFS